MLNTLIPNLSILIVTVRRNLFAAVMTTLMLLLVIITWSSRGNFAVWLSQNPTASQQTDRISRGLKSGDKINEVLGRMRETLNADRVLVRQFNNQVDPATHTNIPSMTTTYYSLAPGVGIDITRLTQPRAYLSDVLQDVWQAGHAPTCTKHELEDIKDSVFSAILLSNGVAVFYSCPIVDLTGAPIGMVEAVYMTKNKERPSDLAIQQTLSVTGDRIAGYIDAVTSPEKDTWYRKLLGS